MSQDNKVMALTPEVAFINFYKSVPDAVLECWNEAIMENLQVSGQKNVSSSFTLKYLSKKIQKKMNCNFEQAKKAGWFDLEKVFRDQGWKVEYDQPAYNESYDSTYYFSNSN